jgi:carbonic anhydrase
MNKSNRVIKFIIYIMFVFSYSQVSAQEDNLYPNTKEFQQSITPDMAIDMLKFGNSLFLNNLSFNREYHTAVQETSQGQYPWAVVHRCMDSRVAPEVIFDLGIGDIFTTGIAGNIIDIDVLGSMEYGCGVVGAKLIVIMGHTECGAVKGAIDNVELGHITDVVQKITPAVNSVKTVIKTDDLTSKNKTFVDDVAVQNVRDVIKNIKSGSQLLRDLEASGQIKIVGAMYDVHTGAVTFLDN